MWYIENKYSKIYFKIIDRAKSRILECYNEEHHILPKSLGGEDIKENIVSLTAKEHFIVYHLLTKMVLPVYQSKMWNAFFLMHIHSTNKRYYNARTYSIAKQKMADSKRLLKGNKNPYYGKKHSKQSRELMSKSWNRDLPRNIDKNIYKFKHDIYGFEECSQKELYTKYNLNNKGVSSLITGRSKTYKGWKLIDGD